MSSLGIFEFPLMMGAWIVCMLGSLGLGVFLLSAFLQISNFLFGERIMRRLKEVMELNNET